MNQKKSSLSWKRILAPISDATVGAPRPLGKLPFHLDLSPRLHASMSAAFALLLHAAMIYAFARDTETTAPLTSVPLTVSFATASEPLHAASKQALRQPRTTQKQTTQTATRSWHTPEPSPVNAPDPTPDQSPAETPSSKREPAPPAVTSPRFDAAYLNNPVPAYPAISRRLGEQGRVLLRAFVNADGSASEVRIHTSSGYARLDHAAREAVARWQFEPARQAGEPVSAWVLVPVSFMLKQG